MKGGNWWKYIGLGGFGRWDPETKQYLPKAAISAAVRSKDMHVRVHMRLLRARRGRDGAYRAGACCSISVSCTLCPWICPWRRGNDAKAQPVQRLSHRVDLSSTSKDAPRFAVPKFFKLKPTYGSMRLSADTDFKVRQCVRGRSLGAMRMPQA